MMRSQIKHFILLFALGLSTFIVLLFSTPTITSGQQSFQAPATETKIFFPLIFKFYPALIVFSSNNTIYTINPENGKLIALGPGDRPKWSPDRKKIAFTIPCCDQPRQLRVMNANGSQVTELSSWTTRSVVHIWSPDGTKIIVVSKDSSLEIFDLDLVNSDGSNLLQVLDGFQDEIEWLH